MLTGLNVIGKSMNLEVQRYSKETGNHILHQPAM
jgi:hypothetical protein